MRIQKLAIPYLLWVVAFTVIPLLLIVHYSFTDSNFHFTLDNVVRFFDPLYISILRHSFEMAAQATVICFIIGYPVAYILSTKEYKNRTVLILLFIVPMWMNFLVRTYAWFFILGNNGVLNNFLSLLGIPTVQILFTDTAVLLGLVYTFLPFMIFPIYSSLQKIEPKIIEAATDLGATNWDILRKIIFPLSLPGVASGLTMVFMPAVATFLISTILGGAQYMLVGNLIEQQFLIVGNRNFGSLVSLVLLVLILLCNLLLSNLTKEEKE